jgi:hypothetical protein
VGPFTRTLTCVRSTGVLYSVSATSRGIGMAFNAVSTIRNGCSVWDAVAHRRLARYSCLRIDIYVAWHPLGTFELTKSVRLITPLLFAVRILEMSVRSTSDHPADIHFFSSTQQGGSALVFMSSTARRQASALGKTWAFMYSIAFRVS